MRGLIALVVVLLLLGWAYSQTEGITLPSFEAKKPKEVKEIENVNAINKKVDTLTISGPGERVYGDDCALGKNTKMEVLQESENGSSAIVKIYCANGLTLTTLVELPKKEGASK